MVSSVRWSVSDPAPEAFTVTCCILSLDVQDGLCCPLVSVRSRAGGFYRIRAEYNAM